MSIRLIVPKASSAGVLVYRRRSQLEVLLVHPGGPFWAKKDDGAWSIPKGEFAEGDDPVAAARRELTEETGLVVDGELRPLGSVTQAGGKVVHAWAVEGDLDAAAIRSNTFSIEWPPRSGRMQQFPEVDRAGWFGIDEARVKLLEGQRPLLDRLIAIVRV
jgi:predicted NUDIX family NTP pyrophosphohydrolase